MDLINFVSDILEPLNIPIAWQIRPEGTPSISYHFFNERGGLFGNGGMERMSVSCQVDIWSKTGHGTIKEQAKKLMKMGGFLEPICHDSYDSDEDKVKLYHTVMVFNYHYKEGECLNGSKESI